MRSLRPDLRRNLFHRLSAGLLAAALVLVVACGDDGPEASSDGAERTTPAVEVLQARSGGLPLEEELNGVVKARNQVPIRPEIEATVTQVLVRSGETVRAGQPLVRLDAEGLDDQLRQAQASTRQAEADAAEALAQVAEIEAMVTRTRALHTEGLVSDMELETQEAQLAAARARASSAQAQVEAARAGTQERRTETGKTVVRSPIAGRVGQRNVEVGMLVDPSSVLFLVGDFDQLIVEVPLTERLLSRVDEGTPVEITAEALGDEPVRASLDRISPFLEAESFSTTAEIDLDGRTGGNGRLRPGMFVGVTVLYGESEQATLVPASALWEDPQSGDLGVYAIAGAANLSPEVASGATISSEAYEFELLPVTVRAAGEATVGVSGLEPDRWVVTVGQQLLADSGRGERGGRGSGPAAGDQLADGATGPPRARVRGADWDNVMSLQQLQREDLLQGFLDKQRTVARELGSDIPDRPEVVDEVLAEQARRNGQNAENPGGR